MTLFVQARAFSCTPFLTCSERTASKDIAELLLPFTCIGDFFLLLYNGNLHFFI